MWTSINYVYIVHQLLIKKVWQQKYSHLSKAKGFWKMLCVFALLLLSISFFWIMYFFFQLSRVVDLKVSLKICLVLKMLLSTFFKVLRFPLLIGWLLTYDMVFLVLGTSVVQPSRQLEVIIIRFCWFIILLLGLPYFFDTLLVNFYGFLNSTRFLISQFSFVHFFLSSKFYICKFSLSEHF